MENIWTTFQEREDVRKGALRKVCEALYTELKHAELSDESIEGIFGLSQAQLRAVLDGVEVPQPVTMEKVMSFLVRIATPLTTPKK